MIQAEVHGKKPVAFAFNGDDQRIARFFRNHRQIRSNKNKKKCKSGKSDDESDGEWLLRNWQLDTDYTYSGAEVLAEFDSKDKITSSYTTGLGIDDHISVTQYKGKRKANTYYYVSDALGSVKKIQDHRGKTVNSYNYTPYGEVYSVKEKINQPYRYTGRRWDSNVGKLWYRSRHYAPGIGRFSQADKWQNSVMNPVGNHAYGYVNGNPVRFVDPWGYKIIYDKNASKNQMDAMNVMQSILKTRPQYYKYFLKLYSAPETDIKIKFSFYNEIPGEEEQISENAIGYSEWWGDASQPEQNKIGKGPYLGEINLFANMDSKEWDSTFMASVLLHEILHEYIELNDKFSYLTEKDFTNIPWKNNNDTDYYNTPHHKIIFPIQDKFLKDIDYENCK
jgi:RHS repeat-associated protein